MKKIFQEIFESIGVVFAPIIVFGWIACPIGIYMILMMIIQSDYTGIVIISIFTFIGLLDFILVLWMLRETPESRERELNEIMAAELIIADRYKED